jgi:hypothetical protein
MAAITPAERTNLIMHASTLWDSTHPPTLTQPQQQRCVTDAPTLGRECPHNNFIRGLIMFVTLPIQPYSASLKSRFVAGALRLNCLGQAVAFEPGFLEAKHG